MMPSSDHRSPLQYNLPSKRIEHTACLLALAMTIGLASVLYRVALIKTSPPQQITKQNTAHHAQRKMLARRGSLLDRRGRILAATRVHHRIFVDPAIIKTPGTFAERIAYELGYDPASVEQKIGDRWNKRYVVIDHNPDQRQLAAARSLQRSIRGLGIEPYVLREYPQGNLAGHVIGFTGTDGRGLEGLERSMDQHVTEQPGIFGYVRDSGGRPLWVDWNTYKTPTDGQPVRLSIDTSIQAIAEQELAATCEKFEAQTGEIIVLDPHTGRVFAMANYPPFNPNEFAKTAPDQRRNRCVTDFFEPGSTFKPFIWAAATESGLADPEELIDCTDIGFYVSPKGRRLRDAHAHGEITWEQVLVKSSNIGMAIVAQRMGNAALYNAVKAFGFGDKTGSGFPGEVPGMVRPLKTWNHYSETSVCMGQEIATTPLQMAAAFSAFANGGLVISPSFIQEVADDAPVEGQAMTEPIYQRAIQPKTADTVRRVLKKVVDEGTGRKAKSKQYQIFGKTGTAQIANPTGRGYLPDQYLASFIAGAPYENPRIIVAAMVHSPNKSIGYYGGTVAAPTVKKVIERTLNYLNIPTQNHPIPQPETQLATAQ